jgi:hypothetical protein
MKLIIGGSADGQAVLNVLHYKYTGASVTGASLDAFITAWRTAHLAQWLAVHGSNYVVSYITATDISTLTGNTATQLLTTGNAGTGGSVCAPLNVAFSVSWRTGVVGRRNRGRTYLGGLPTGHIAGDGVDSGLLSSIATLAAGIMGQTFTGGYDFAVTSVADVLSKVVTSAILDLVLDSMRNRLPGRGI